MLMDPHPSQQHAGLHHKQEVTKLKARFKPTYFSDEVGLEVWSGWGSKSGASPELLMVIMIF